MEISSGFGGPILKLTEGVQKIARSVRGDSPHWNGQAAKDLASILKWDSDSIRDFDYEAGPLMRVASATLVSSGCETGRTDDDSDLIKRLALDRVICEAFPCHVRLLRLSIITACNSATAERCSSTAKRLTGPARQRTSSRHLTALAMIRHEGPSLDCVDDVTALVKDVAKTFLSKPNRRVAA
ncbi:hypothetical protein Pmar_PMAR016535 [Perkinsus marinus ATCC 50983]|uniref:HAT C-terminal dimerisation domain-containing protein n=1 Tax=Perkinsus marinus (strain ATCC 50983 / TXsc) TaxID=423536 RepID=C5LNQ6_PERM5|nr:hypothetical protein Pmar_PMAR016535 [Perkinsus marinus ATCC 50983]EER01637.1 hypothetical protein Pmar_PMAR016535 [Perkinsus marinus ATCC 50983]|eukprot:XP_002768919.1 hypothetical protein Pmar_PMAR016535 [Perkinsus marinus ATCC 50983]